jgi:Anaphase promoting complex (APC) subunit 2
VCVFFTLFSSDAYLMYLFSLRSCVTRMSIVVPLVVCRVDATLSLEELQTRTDLKAESLRRALQFWVGKTVLVEESANGAKLYRQRHASDLVSVDDAAAAAEEEDEEGGGAMRLEEAEQWETWSKFVLGMLGTYSSMAPVQIHSNLSMFVGDFDKSEAELVAYLRRLCQQDIIDLRDGEYVLKK